MKGIIIKISAFSLLAAASFGAGILIAENKISKVSQKEIVNQTKEAEDVTENKIANLENIEITEENDQTDIANEIAEEEKKEPVKFSFAILGDTQYFKPGTSGGYQTAANSIKKLNPDLVFAMGDLVSSCDNSSECEGKYGSWKSVLGSLSSRTYATQGNHDRTGKDKSDASWQKVFAFPGNGPSGFSELAYSFDKENSHFVILDSDKPEENLINGTQRSWLDQDLAKNKKENTFVFFHEPAYPMNSKMGESLDVNPKDRDALWNILTKYKVTAVFVGHEHIQARRKVNGIYQFTFGNVQSSSHLAPKPGTAEYSYIGQGFGLIEVNGKEIAVKTLGLGGNLLNSFTLNKT